MIAAVVLAAGASQRMGQPKALLSIAGETLFFRVASTAQQAGAAVIVGVVGPPHGDLIQEQVGQLVRQRCANLDLRWAWNAEPQRGMLSSVQTALPLVPTAASGVLIWPVDVPFVAITSVRALCAADRTRLAVLTSGGRGGHPLWLPRQLFLETLTLAPEVGLRALRAQHPLVRVEVEDPEVLRDLDTPEDLALATTCLGVHKG